MLSSGVVSVGVNCSSLVAVVLVSLLKYTTKLCYYIESKIPLQADAEICAQYWITYSGYIQTISQEINTILKT